MNPAHESSHGLPDLPEQIPTVDALEELLSRPSPEVVEALGRLRGDLIFLGAGGKMGPTLARMARRATDAAGVARRVLAVSRFSDREARERLREYGVETLEADLADPRQLRELPDAENVVSMFGFKFGASGDPSTTWAVNCLLPAAVMERYRSSRVVVFSSGNVYGLTPLIEGGATEDDPPAPTDEYGMTCLGRERVVEHASRRSGTASALLRLNYAVELRYGVLVDIARMVAAGEPVDVTTGHFNVIWQADANGMALRALEAVSSPPHVINLAGPEILSVRRVAGHFGELLDRPVTIRGAEAPNGFLSNGQRGHEAFGYPSVPVRRVIRWTADWIARGGVTLDKPTKFQVRDGKF